MQRLEEEEEAGAGDGGCGWQVVHDGPACHWHMVVQRVAACMLAAGPAALQQAACCVALDALCDQLVRLTEAEQLGRHSHVVCVFCPVCVCLSGLGHAADEAVAVVTHACMAL
jgi:hypothetical protein